MNLRKGNKVKANANHLSDFLKIILRERERKKGRNPSDGKGKILGFLLPRTKRQVPRCHMHKRR